MTVSGVLGSGVNDIALVSGVSKGCNGVSDLFERVTRNVWPSSSIWACRSIKESKLNFGQRTQRTMCGVGPHGASDPLNGCIACGAIDKEEVFSFIVMRMLLA